MTKQTIKWLLFHEPAELFIRTAEHFESEINRLTGDQYKIEILKLEDYNEKYNNGQACDPITELKEGRVHMSQLYSNALAHRDAYNFFALGLPFLFRDHDHCARVLEGEIGDELMSHLHETVQVKGLSFTYSGGYKCMAADRRIKSVEDFTDLSTMYQASPVFTEMFKALGMKTADKQSDANLAQTTLPRYHVETTASQKHVMSVDHQLKFKQAAKTCARAERAKSVADAEEIKNEQSKQDERGIESISDLADQDVLRAKLEAVTDRLGKFFGNDLVDRIKKS